MRLGTLIIDIFVVPAWILRIEKLENIISPLLKSIGPYHDFDYRHFGYIRANLKWVAQIEQFWKNDTIFNTIRSYLYENFTYWELTITLITEERGG